MTKPSRLLIVDDSATARAALRAALAGDPQLEVVGDASDRASALRLIRELSPDLITMDVFLRTESGLDLAASIMETRATPIVVITAADIKQPGLLFRALSTGVLDVCAKLPSLSHPDYEVRRARLKRTLKTLARVPVIHRAAAPRKPAQTPYVPAPEPTRSHIADAQRCSLLLIGASTGGPPAVANLLRSLPKPLAISVALVQHIATGFTQGFAKWLADDTGHSISVVNTSRPLQGGIVYLPCDERHLVFESNVRLGTSAEVTNSPYRPSIDLLFNSAVAAGLGVRTVAVLLTGMGRDGARGLLALRRAGAHTIVQEPKSCAVSSMPLQALELDAAELVLLPEAMPPAILARTCS